MIMDIARVYLLSVLSRDLRGMLFYEVHISILERSPT